MHLQAVAVAPSRTIFAAVMAQRLVNSARPSSPKSRARNVPTRPMEKMPHDDAACFCLPASLDERLIAGKRPPSP
jgi:hypothetical protein